MVLVFLGLNLVLGLYCTNKTTTFRQYAVGNKRFKTATLVLTVLATTFGGGTLMCTMPSYYNFGIEYIIPLIGTCANIWMISLLGLRMGPFMKHLSIAETIGNVYGKYPRVIAALLGICFSIGVLAMQINVMSYAIGVCIDSVDPRIVTLLATLIFIVYDMLGGVRAITITDIFQFIISIVIIALLTSLQSFLSCNALQLCYVRFYCNN